MQEMIYTCDYCRARIGDKVHISIQFAGFSGIAIPPNNQRKGWSVHGGIAGKFTHFCNPLHMKQYVDSLMKKIEKENKICTK